MSLREVESRREVEIEEARQIALPISPQKAATDSTAETAVDPPQSEPSPIPRKGPISWERIYNRDFKEVEVLYKKGDWGGAIEAAKCNLSDPTLPRWHIIRNHLMWAHAAEWYSEAEEHRLIAEGVYAEARMLTPRSASIDNECLRRVRMDLDVLKEAQEEDLRDMEQSVPPSDDLPYRGKQVDKGEGNSGSGGKGKDEGGSGMHEDAGG